MKEKKMSYNEAYNRIKEIQGLIEQDEVDLDDLANLLKEAGSLLALCKDKLLKVNEETQKIIDNLE